MQPDQPSETAKLAAIMRAAHQILDDDPKILVDEIGVGLVEGTSEPDIRQQEESLREPTSLVLRSIFAYRSRFVEQRLEAAVAQGVPQYVILGAGLDTFAYRQPQWASNIRVIEVDHPTSQRLKQACLRRSSIEVPANTSWCAVDFEHTSLDEGLTGCPYDPQAPAFFSWLGVTQYLTRSALEKTLRFCAACPPGSRIAFTIELPLELLSGLGRQVSEYSERYCEDRGEPWLSRLAPDPMADWLRDLGFSKVECPTPEIVQDRYFRGREDGLAAPSMMRVLCAEV